LLVGVPRVNAIPAGVVALFCRTRFVLLAKPPIEKALLVTELSKTSVLAAKVRLLFWSAREFERLRTSPELTVVPPV
jgi:hypothetical protein